MKFYLAILAFCVVIPITPPLPIAVLLYDTSGGPLELRLMLVVITEYKNLLP